MILEGRVAIVTGAGSGIGRAGALMMAREGATIISADRDSAAGEATAEAITAAGGHAQAIPTDVSDDAAQDRLIAETMAGYVLPAVLILAGIWILVRQYVHDESPSDKLKSG